MNFSDLNIEHLPACNALSEAIAGRKIENSPMGHRRGFTLIELLVVIFVIGILAGLLLPNLVASRQRARDSRRKHDLVEIKNALRLYYNDNQTYPDSDVFSFGASWTDGSTTYMSQVPQDPQGGERNYHYCVSSDANSFILAAELENLGDSDMPESMNRCRAPDWSALGGCDLSDCADPSDNDLSNCYYVCGD